MKIKTAIPSLCLLLFLPALATGCDEDTYTLTIHLGAELPTDTYDLRVWRQSNGEVVLERSGQPVGPDISQPGHELSLDVEVPEAGYYVVLVAGHSSAATQLSIQALSVSTQTDVDIVLVDIGVADADHDGFITPADCYALDSPSIDCTYYDCDDGNDAIHPSAEEICGNGIDENCDDLDPLCPE